MCVCSIAFRNSRNNPPEFTDVQDTKRYGVLSDYVQKSPHRTIHYIAYRRKSNKSYWDSFFSKRQFQRCLYRLRPPGYSKKFMVLSGESIPAVQKGRSICQTDLSKCLCGFHAGRDFSLQQITCTPCAEKFFNASSGIPESVNKYTDLTYHQTQ